MNNYEYTAQFYDRLTDNVDYVKMANFIHKRIGGAQNMLTLDLACGTGRLTSLLSNMGYDMIGVDHSAEMLSVAHARFGIGGKTPMLLCQKLDELDLFGTVGSAVCTLDSINHIEHGDKLGSTSRLKRIFSRIATFLEPHGMFIFDVNTLYKHSDVLAGNSFIYDSDDLFGAWSYTSLSPDNHTIAAVIDVFVRNDDGSYSRFTDSVEEHYYSDEVVRTLLHECGFEDVEMFDDYDELKPSKHTLRVVYTAKRTA